MTSREINALPERVRSYIRDLETRCDPAGDIQTIASLREQVAALEFLLSEEPQRVSTEEANKAAEVWLRAQGYSQWSDQTWMDHSGYEADALYVLAQYIESKGDL